MIVPGDPASRDKIIKATNSQTSIPPASLRATDKIHRDIEDHLKPRGLFYDRRKNFYKNQSIPAEKIVAIPYLAQAVMAIALRRPDNARSRPSSLLKNDEDCKQVFDANRSIDVYFVCASLMKRAEGYLRTDNSVGATAKGNIRFHVAMAAVGLHTGVSAPSMKQIGEIDPSGVTDATLAQGTELVFAEFNSMGGTDAVAKSGDFSQRVSDRIKHLLHPQAKREPAKGAAETGPGEAGN